MKKLKYTKTRGLIHILRALKYKDYPVYIRMIGSELFMYDIIYGNELYSSYIIVTPAKGKTKLSKKEIMGATALINAGAESTIDTLLGVQLSKEDKHRAEIVSGVN